MCFVKHARMLVVPRFCTEFKRDGNLPLYHVETHRAIINSSSPYMGMHPVNLRYFMGNLRDLRVG